MSTLQIESLTLRRHDVSHRTTWYVTEVTTDDGRIGIGECSDIRRSDAVEAVWADVVRTVLGGGSVADPEQLDDAITHLVALSDDPRQRFLRRLIGGSVVTAVCDIAAQNAGQTLAGWLGGSSQTTVALYANINRAPVDRTPTEFVRVAVAAVSSGFDRIKVAPFDGPPIAGSSLRETGLTILAEIRAAIGIEPTLLVDMHGRLSRDDLVPAIAAMEELKIGWLEDAVDDRDHAELEWLAASTSMPLAGGELLTEPDDVDALCSGGWLTHLLLDAKYIGGPLRYRDMLESVHGNVSLTLHDPTGPLSTLVSAHLTMLRSDPGYLEYPFGEDVDRSALTDPGETLDGNWLQVPSSPGIGMRLTAGSFASLALSSEDVR
jgi:galactonate dehydratase